MLISGKYAFVSIQPGESNKTISQKVSNDALIHKSIGEQCLQYYYYFTIYNGANWGQLISVSIEHDNKTNNITEMVDNLLFSDSKENRWHNRSITFNPAWSNYTVIYIDLNLKQNTLKFCF